ncbi:MAG: c-type cytochrome [Burkholderiales bacterium]|nr:c-type cytochrome [Burkholderiales bacterium]
MQDVRSRGRRFASNRPAPSRKRDPAPWWLPLATVTAAAACALAACGGGDDGPSAAEQAALESQGKQIFRYDTFGDEAQWTDTLRMHEVISAAVDPVTALSVGLKVDAEALPAAVVQGIQNGSIDLTSPATTIALLKLDAVVGLKGTVESVGGQDVLTHVGITCALCHSTVDNSFAPGIGRRLDGWPNRDLNPGAIIALSPAVDAATKAQLNAWGAGKFDPRHNIDGLSKPVVIPPAFGLAGVHRVTFTGDGTELAYWNRYVAVAEMGGLGTVTEPRLGLSITNGNVDLVTAKLPALQAYQLSIAAPAAPTGSFDPVAAARGQQVFSGAGRCATCHSGSQFTDANSTLHPPADSMAEPESPSYASRSASKLYRTSPLKGVWQHAPYFHDGSAATLADVVGIYNTRKSLGLTAQQSADLVEYLKSL